MKDSPSRISFIGLHTESVMVMFSCGLKDISEKRALVTDHSPSERNAADGPDITLTKRGEERHFSQSLHWVSRSHNCIDG